jgi:GntR family transcriptional regulator
MELKISYKSKVPLHVQVEELIRNLLVLPEYKNGAFLPKETELANRLGVSRNTIRQATNKLEYEGLLIRKKGVGTKVAPQKKLATQLSNWYSFTKEMQGRGIQVINLSLKIETVLATEKAAFFFNIKPKTPLIKLAKLKGAGENPIVYFESYFHPRIKLSIKDNLNKPLYELLEEKFGIIAERSSEQISAKTAGKFAEKLKVTKEAPILFRERFVYDVGDRPIEYNLGYYHPKFTYSIDIRK